MKTIKECSNEAYDYEDREANGFNNGYWEALKDVIKLIDKMESYMSEFSAEQVIFKDILKKRIEG